MREGDGERNLQSSSDVPMVARGSLAVYTSMALILGGNVEFAVGWSSTFRVLEYWPEKEYSSGTLGWLLIWTYRSRKYQRI